MQTAVRKGQTRFLFEMATGTGKTLTAAAVIKLFMRTVNAKRVLFLVDRLELETQAWKAFVRLLKNDFHTVIYKENRDDWRKAEIVVATVQSLQFNNKYRRLFSPTDFDLLISDEAHRSLGGNSRAVFEYFIGYKLGLTATPKDYLKQIDPARISQRDPRQWERRQLLDTYKTFGCESGTPTFRYSLIDGVSEGYLLNPVVVDARTEITTELLAEEGFAVMQRDDDGEMVEQTFFGKDFEKKLFSDETNRVFCETFLKSALRDPLSGEIGKTIVFCVRQDHATRTAKKLNDLADALFPGKYNSDFAVQVTSLVPDAQQMAAGFANNNLNGHTRFLDGYVSSKTRVCVTVGMMTTGYDCQDLLNVVLLRPIFSPTDFIQIKGRGTRKYTFRYSEKAHGQAQEHAKPKEAFKLFDFFAVCEYFEEKFDYDEIIRLPPIKGSGGGEGGGSGGADPQFSNVNPDPIKSQVEYAVPVYGMKIDRKFFEKFEDRVKAAAEVRKRYERGDVQGGGGNRGGRVVQQAGGLLQPRQAPQGGAGRPADHAPRGPGQGLRRDRTLQDQGRTAGGGTGQVRLHPPARRPAHAADPPVFQGLRHRRRGLRDRRRARVRPSGRQPQGLPRRHQGPERLAGGHPGIREGLRLAERFRGIMRCIRHGAPACGSCAVADGTRSVPDTLEKPHVRR